MNQDVYGAALFDFYKTGKTAPLILHNNYGEDEEMPVDLFFREEEEFPELEFIALSLCDGVVLDVGAGAGSHCLYLQNRGFEVTALEISKTACEIMKDRGVKQVVNANIFHYRKKKFD